MAAISNKIEFTSGSTVISVSQSIEVAGPSGSMTTMIDDSTAVVMGTWGLEGSDQKNIEFRIPSASFSGSSDRIPFYYSASGKIGINTSSPTKDFEISGEIKTVKRTTSTGSILEVAYDREGAKAVVGDNMGGLKWNDENEAGNPGDSAAIYSVCTNATVNGTAGDIIFLTTDPSDSTTIAQPPREVVRIKATGEISASAYIGPIDGGTY
tara:strand:+ start:5363 stop:5992 length:630 start_codon:yes stop_codon:yes gene_type:complete